MRSNLMNKSEKFWDRSAREYETKKINWETIDIETSQTVNESNPFSQIINEQNKEKDEMLEKLKNIDLSTPEQDQFNEEDKNTFFLFERNGFIHPMGLMAVLDETMGWGGFFASSNGGVSVRLNYKLLRRIGVNEKMVFFGRGEKVMGRIDKRMLFWASSHTTAVKKPPSNTDLVLKRAKLCAGSYRA